MKEEKTPYECQIFVCTNDRQGESPSCGDQKGEDIFKELRRIAKERGIHPRIRVAQAKCLGKCSLGTNIMVYPQNIWFGQFSLADINKIVEKFFPPAPK